MLIVISRSNRMSLTVQNLKDIGGYYHIKQRKFSQQRSWNYGVLINILIKSATCFSFTLKCLKYVYRLIPISF